MHIEINNKPHTIQDGTTISLLIENLNIPLAGTAIAVNMKVIPKKLWDETILSDGDKITLIRATCGG